MVVLEFFDDFTSFRVCTSMSLSSDSRGGGELHTPSPS